MGSETSRCNYIRVGNRPTTMICVIPQALSTSPAKMLFTQHILHPSGAQSPVKGPENLCRAKIVEKCRTCVWHFWRFLKFLPCTKNVEKCRRWFWHFSTIFDVAPFPWPLLRSAEVPNGVFEDGGLRHGQRVLTLSGTWTRMQVCHSERATGDAHMHDLHCITTRGQALLSYAGACRKSARSKTAI